MPFEYVFLIIHFIYSLCISYLIIMDSVSQRNRKANANGEWGERKAKKILLNRFEQIEKVNSIVDFMLNDKVPIEVKTCQIKIKTGQTNYPERMGRFILFEEQHNYLVDNSGMYLFIVKNDRFIHAWKLMDASKISYRRHVQWNRIIERR